MYNFIIVGSTIIGIESNFGIKNYIMSYNDYPDVYYYGLYWDHGKLMKESFPRNELQKDLTGLDYVIKAIKRFSHNGNFSYEAHILDKNLNRASIGKDGWSTRSKIVEHSVSWTGSYIKDIELVSPDGEENTVEFKKLGDFKIGTFNLSQVADLLKAMKKLNSWNAYQAQIELIDLKAKYESLEQKVQLLEGENKELREKLDSIL